MNYTESEWNGYKRLDFFFKEHAAIVVLNENENHTNKWLFKTEYFDAFQELELEMVNRGYNLAYVSATSRWAPEEEIDIKAEFSDFLHEEFGFSEKCLPIGMSCGGLQAAMLAEKYPEKIGAMYLDAPVLNILSMAGLGSAPFSEGMWEEISNTFGVSRSTIVNFRKSPIDNMDVLTDNNIPIVLAYGNADRVVPFLENGNVLLEHYKKHNGIIKVICRSMCEHHPHTPTNIKATADFLQMYY